MLRDSISQLMASNDERRNGNSGFILPRYGGAASSINGNAIDVVNVDTNDVFELGEVPMHLIREFKSTYS